MDLVGELVKLRAPVPEDAPAVAAALADPEVVRYLRNWSWRPYALSDAQDFLARRDPATITWAIESRQDATCIGVTSLFDLDFRNRHCEWGLWIGPPERWGRGCGTETCRLAVRFAFRQLGMEKVYLEVYEENERGRRAYEKAGFAVEGRLPRDHFMDGRFVTTLVMAVYRDSPLYAV